MLPWHPKVPAFHGVIPIDGMARTFISCFSCRGSYHMKWQAFSATATNNLKGLPVRAGTCTAPVWVKLCSFGWETYDWGHTNITMAASCFSVCGLPCNTDDFWWFRGIALPFCIMTLTYRPRMCCHGHMGWFSSPPVWFSHYGSRSGGIWGIPKHP